MRPWSWAGQVAVAVQWKVGLPASSHASGAPQTGHFLGNLKTCSSAGAGLVQGCST